MVVLDPSGVYEYSIRSSIDLGYPVADDLHRRVDRPSLSLKGVGRIWNTAGIQAAWTFLAFGIVAEPAELELKALEEGLGAR